MPRLRPTLTPTTGTTATALPPTTPTPPGQESVDTDSLPLATDAADTDIISASDPLTLMPTPTLTTVADTDMDLATTVMDTAVLDTMVMDMVILDTDTVLPTMLALSLTPTDPSKDFMAANVVMLTPTPMLMLTMDMDMVADTDMDMVTTVVGTDTDMATTDTDFVDTTATDTDMLTGVKP